jgi:hypothetical protein
MYPRRDGRTPGEREKRLLHSRECPLREVCGIGVIAGQSPQESVNTFIIRLDEEDCRAGSIPAGQLFQRIIVQIHFRLICLVE